MPGLGASFGRGAATSFQEDLQNSDCILIMGSNMAEAHPVGFRFPMMARERGAKLIHVDPHFSRTSAMCQQYVKIRTGTDIAFLGGLIHYILLHDKWFKDYVLAYTNAATIVNDEYKDAEDLGGIFSGFDQEKRTYDAQKTWHYEGEGEGERTQAGHHMKAESFTERTGHLENPLPPSDPTLQNPNCVLNILKRHYRRYTPEMVADICGCSEQDFVRVAETICSNSGRERTCCIVYAVGWTQHSTGVQIIRSATIVQLLLGNMGRPGGGIMAMRGHASIQGSTDVPTLYELLPGYIMQPSALRDHGTLECYLKQETPKTGFMANLPKFMVSLLKAWYGDAATKENEYGFKWIPRVDDNYSHLACMIRMLEGKIKGMFLFGQNPAAGAPNGKLNREALKKLDWLVVRDWFEIDTAAFWYKGPENPDPATIGTEVFFIPAASSAEKEGTFTNTQRLLQWHDKAIDPPEDCRSDTWFVYELGKRLKKLYAGSTRERDQGLLNLTWDYEFDRAEVLPDGSASRIEGEPDAQKILMEINGYTVADRKQVRDFNSLRDDGSTACGCWIYSGVFPEEGNNRSRSRKLTPGVYTSPDWGFSWPLNRRMMYNRASADPDGRPWSERKKYMWWDEENKRWTGPDVPDFEPTKPPDYRPNSDSTGMQAISGDAPFIMKPDGRGWLFAPMGVKDGPLPTHYEPIESPIPNLLYPEQRVNPTIELYHVPLNTYNRPTAEYPIVATNYRLTEHYLSGPMSRFDSWLNELQPGMFIEISAELAEEKGIDHGGWMVAWNSRCAIEARAMVTRRVQPPIVNGRTVHQIGMPFHWGFAGETVGAIANDLTSISADPNVSMHEAKAFTVDVRAGRLEHHEDIKPLPAAPWPTREESPDTSKSAQPEGQAI
ncbi:formate dehydrogenase-N subunit alpha [Occallatibacter riparius]|uniref:Formate dehydrogenase-N subunit alpha n=1 Tax=Occallatibacter riparius TaxID=1002689 RepID=A0A9J7BUH2_9BACT|nr:formate dehydrogenase-N subunit alpha [Occallatibacter riparius]